MQRVMSAAAVALAVLLLAGCGDGIAVGGDSVRPLAKADGWRASLDFEDIQWALGEVADDRATAEQAWRDSLPADLPEQSGDPDEPGRYGSLDDVDFDTHVVVVWSSGQSGTCPEWIDDLSTEDGIVQASREQVPAQACTDDYNPYTLLLAVDRDRLPALEDLPADVISNGITGGRLVRYPDEG